MFTPQQSVELFHLYFCRYLDQNLEKKLYSIKGGCNLRFFHQSIRYSEDLDIDTDIIALKTLENKVDRILKNAAFLQNLKQFEIEITSVSKPKQTETVQRWKIQIRNKDLTLPTKIEFSRRGLDPDQLYEAIHPELISNYKMYPILCSHYGVAGALDQKVKALIYRTETQARDLFDLDLLLKKMKPTVLQVSKEEKIKALKNMTLITFNDFQSQVVSYLMPDYQNYFKDQKVWGNLQKSVSNFLESL